MKTKHTFAFTFFLGLIWTGVLFAYSSGPDPGVNGVVSGTTCNQSGCHNSFTLNSGTGSVSIGGLPSTWTAGQTYALTVTVSLSGSSRYGFQFSAVNDTTNAQAGTLLAASPNDSRVQIITGTVGGNSLQFTQHNSTFFSPGTPFSFRWTAPSSASFGDVRFNVAGNAANGDATSTGDRIYTTSAIRSAASDLTAPVISSVTSSAITSSTATITWTTDEASDSQVELGTTTAYGTSTTLDTTLATSHSVNLSGLSASTLYHYRVKSRDAASNLATGTDVTFTTSAPSDSSAPIISAVTASSVMSGEATITWTTDEGSDTQVEYGATTSYGESTTLSITSVTSHSANLPGLSSNTTYHYRVKSRDATGNLATGSDNTFITAFAVGNLGSVSRTTDGSGSLTTGYGRIVATSGTTPSGVAIFGYRQSGILVTEAGVPDSPLIFAGRIYAEVSSNGLVNTGLAIANPNPSTATIDFVVRDTTGATIRAGFTTIGPNQHLAKFIDQDPYLSGTGIQGTFSFTSTIPVSVVALRGFYNERSPSEFLITTLPVLDLASSGSSGTQVIPHFAAGEGWTTQIVLVNPTSTAQTGTVQFLDNSGVASSVSIDGGTGTSTAYSVAANSSRKFVITAATSALAAGSVRIVPTGAGPVPTPLLIFSYKPASITVSEAGVPVTMGTTFRMFAQLSSSPQILSGIAVANATTTPGTVTLALTSLDGSTTLGTSAPQPLPASGKIAGFLDQLIPSLAGQTVEGVLRITTDVSSISVVGLRARYNERLPTADFLITTTPPTAENSAPTTAERLFPHLVNGDGYTTQVILFSGTTGQTSGGALSFVKPDGTPLVLDIN